METVNGRVEARIQGPLEVADPTDRIRPRDLDKLIHFLKLRKACGTDGFPNEYLIHLPRRPLVRLTHLINHCIRLSDLPTSWKEVNVIALPKPGKEPKFSQNLVGLSVYLLSLLGNDSSNTFPRQRIIVRGVVFYVLFSELPVFSK
jgi:hypothetical protein